MLDTRKALCKKHVSLSRLSDLLTYRFLRSLLFSSPTEGLVIFFLVCLPSPLLQSTAPHNIQDELGKHEVLFEVKSQETEFNARHQMKVRSRGFPYSSRNTDRFRLTVLRCYCRQCSEKERTGNTCNGMYVPLFSVLTTEVVHTSS